MSQTKLAIMKSKWTRKQQLKSLTVMGSLLLK